MASLLLRLALLTWLFVVTPALWTLPPPPLSPPPSFHDDDRDDEPPQRRVLRFLESMLPPPPPPPPPPSSKPECALSPSACDAPWLLPALGALHVFVAALPRALARPPLKHLRSMERAFYLAALQTAGLVSVRAFLGPAVMRVVALHAAVRYALDLGARLPDARPLLALLVLAEAPLCPALAASSWEHFLGFVLTDLCSDAVGLALP